MGPSSTPTSSELIWPWSRLPLQLMVMIHNSHKQHLSMTSQSLFFLEISTMVSWPQLSNVWWMPTLLRKGLGRNQGNDTPQPICDLQVGFSLLWIKVNQDNPKVTFKGKLWNLTIGCRESFDWMLVLMSGYVLMPGPKPLLIESGIHYRLESWLNTFPETFYNNLDIRKRIFHEYRSYTYSTLLLSKVLGFFLLKLFKNICWEKGKKSETFHFYLFNFKKIV